MTSKPLRILLAGATGYIGKAVASELAARGHAVTAVLRSDVTVPGCDAVRLDDLCDVQQAIGRFGDQRFDAVVSCIASRTGVPTDAWRVDHEANRTLLRIAEHTGCQRFLLLSAICVQRPRLDFQHAKLAFESELGASAVDHTIIRPTAFFKSLSGQIARVQAGKPFLVFGKGTETACKPVCASDLAAFIANHVTSDEGRNAILPIGGPGAAITPRDQGEMLFELSGRRPKFRSVSPKIFKIAAAALSPLGLFWPAAREKAELAKIGHYYATESMLVWNEAKGSYDAEATPSTGHRTLREHYSEMLAAAEHRDELGSHRVF